jgi:hypothetical protein
LGKEGAGQEVWPHHQHRVGCADATLIDGNVNGQHLSSARRDARQRDVSIEVAETPNRNVRWGRGARAAEGETSKAKPTHLSVQSQAGEPRRCIGPTRVNLQQITGNRAKRRATGQPPRHPTGNMANPMIGSRAQQTCKLMRGVNRRSSEKEQGRNEPRSWQT